MNTGKDGVKVKGKLWFTIITRNMSFWHGILDDAGNLSPKAWFDEKSNSKTYSDGMRLTLNGYESTCFRTDPNYKEYTSSIMNFVSTKKKLSKFSQKYATLSNNLISSLNDLIKTTTPDSLAKFMKEYSKFSPGLLITAVIGRRGYEELKAELQKAGVNKNKHSEIINAITYPKEHTPVYSSAIAVLEICSKIKDNMDDFTIEKMKHDWLRLYQHIPVNFCDEPWTINDLNDQIKSSLKKDCKSELIRSEKSHNKKIWQKEKILSELDNKKITLLADAIATATYLNEFRKGIFSKVSLGFRPVQKKLAKLAGSSNWRDCYYLTPNECMNILSGNKDKINMKKLVSERKIIATCTVKNTNKNYPMILSKNDTNKIYKFVSKLHGKDNGEKNSVEVEVSSSSLSNEVILKGLAANQGKAKGFAKIIFGKRDFAKFNSGDVLIAPMTSVDYVLLMEKASAFVTNEGGITSHASIVSREMNKPCVIGTGNATAIIKDGDLIEVDGSKGIVKIIKKYNVIKRI